MINCNLTIQRKPQINFGQNKGKNDKFLTVKEAFACTCAALIVGIPSGIYLAQRPNIIRQPQQPITNVNTTTAAKTEVPRVKTTLEIPGIKDPKVLELLTEINDLEFDKEDIKALEKMGINVFHKNGKEVIATLKKSIKEMGFEDAPIIMYGKTQPQFLEQRYRADYKFDEETYQLCVKYRPDCKDKIPKEDIKAGQIILNSRYQNTKDPLVKFAVASALVHEINHSIFGPKKTDTLKYPNSIQEEMDSIGQNSLAWRAFEKKNPDIFENMPKKLDPKTLKDEKDPIKFNEKLAKFISLDMDLQAKALFDEDPEKKDFIKLITGAYLGLKLESSLHQVPDVENPLVELYKKTVKGDKKLREQEAMIITLSEPQALEAK